MPDDEKLAAVRAGLPAVGAGIYLNTPVAGPLPAETAHSMADLATWELTIGRAARDRIDEAWSRVDEARGAIAAILTTDVDAVTLTHGVADAVRRAAAMAGAEPLSVEVAAGADDAAILAVFEGAIVPGTRLVSVPHVHPATGARWPVAAIAALAHQRGAAVLADGSQAAGAIPVLLEDLGVDFYVLPGSTWLLGPEGLGALAVSGRRSPLAGLEELDPAPFDFHLPAVVGLARSCGWLSMYVGLEWIHGRGGELTSQAAARLGDIDGVELLTPLDRLATIVSFRIRGWSAADALGELGARAFVLASVLPSLDAIRVGFGFFNTTAEIERLAETVELLARHGPASLPPRRRLSVIGQP
jgi:cysteine desulfurase/selenocysteine lyase